jgi:5-methylcytosine-specific restriction enzyme A
MSPYRAKSFCSHPGCRAYAAPGSSYCVDHGHTTQREYDKTRSDDPTHLFYLTPAWRAVREQYLALHPCCEECQKAGLVTAATLVHHRLEVTERPDLALDPANCEALCPSCHNIVHGDLKGGAHEW